MFPVAGHFQYADNHYRSLLGFGPGGAGNRSAPFADRSLALVYILEVRDARLASRPKLEVTSHDHSSLCHTRPIRKRGSHACGPRRRWRPRRRMEAGRRRQRQSRRDPFGAAALCARASADRPVGARRRQEPGAEPGACPPRRRSDRPYRRRHHSRSGLVGAAARGGRVAHRMHRSSPGRSSRYGPDACPPSSPRRPWTTASSMPRTSSRRDGASPKWFSGRTWPFGPASSGTGSPSRRVSVPITPSARISWAATPISCASCMPPVIVPGSWPRRRCSTWSGRTS